MKFTPLFIAVLAATSFLAMAKPPEPLTSLDETLATAARENKMTFILLGRATCGNCNATKAMIRAGQVFITDSHFVMADLNCDDPKINGAFLKKFGKEKFGDTLPFVVITNAHGRLLASSGGYKEAGEWNNLLNAAKSKERKLAGPGGTGARDSWPFSSPTPAPR